MRSRAPTCDCQLEISPRFPVDGGLPSVFLKGCQLNEAAMTPFDAISVTIAIVGLAGGFAYAGIQIGKWIGEKK